MHSVALNPDSARQDRRQRRRIRRENQAVFVMDPYLERLADLDRRLALLERVAVAFSLFFLARRYPLCLTTLLRKNLQNHSVRQ